MNRLTWKEWKPFHSAQPLHKDEPSPMCLPAGFQSLSSGGLPQSARKPCCASLWDTPPTRCWRSGATCACHLRKTWEHAAMPAAGRDSKSWKPETTAFLSEADRFSSADLSLQGQLFSDPLFAVNELANFVKHWSCLRAQGFLGFPHPHPSNQFCS